MDTRLLAGGSPTDVKITETAPRVTPANGAPFRDFVTRGASTLVRGAEAAATVLPGGSLVAAAVRGGSPSASAASAPPAGSSSGNPLAVTPLASPVAAGGTAENPLGGAGTGTGGEVPAVEQSLAQSQAFNLYYLQLQEQLASENRSYTAMSNVLKARHDTVKNAIGNIR
jgi:hypothetical protein